MSVLQVIDRCGPAEMLRLLLQHDKAFASVQEQHQEQYSKLCQTLKKAQRYPVSWTVVSTARPSSGRHSWQA